MSSAIRRSTRRSFPSTRYPLSSFLHSDSVVTPESAAPSSATEPTENGGGFIPSDHADDPSSPKSAEALPLSRAACPASDVFSAPAVQFSSRLSPKLSSNLTVFGSIGESNASDTLSYLVNYNDDTEDLDGTPAVTPPGHANSPLAFGSVTNAFSTPTTPGNTPDVVHTVSALSTLSGGGAHRALAAPPLEQVTCDAQPQFVRSLDACTASDNFLLPKRKIPAHSSRSPLKRSRRANPLIPAAGSAPSSVVIGGVTFVPAESVTPSPVGGTFDLAASSGPPAGQAQYFSDDEIEFVSPPRISRSPTIASDIDMYGALDIDLPADLDSIPALATPPAPKSNSNLASFSFQSRIGSSALPSSSLPPSPTKKAPTPTTPTRKDLRKIAKLPGSPSASRSPTTRGSATRLADIQKALASVATQDATPTRSNFSPRAASPATPSAAPQRRSLLSQIDSIIPATPRVSSNSPPSDYFHDGGLSQEGCLHLDLFDIFLAPTYTTVLNLRMPVLYPIVANTPVAVDADWLPFRDVYSRLALIEKRSAFRCVVFANLGCFVNPSRANPNVVQQVPSGKGTIGLCPSGNARLARHTSLFLTTGIVQRSSLYSVVPVTLANNNVRVVRELLLRPFQQEFQRLAGFFGSAFSFDTAAFPASAGCISLTSTQFFEDQRNKVNDDYSPVATIRQSTRPPRYAESDHRLTVMGQFKANTSFADPSEFAALLPQVYLSSFATALHSSVPIYDGRCAGTDSAFECDPNQLHELAISSYPLYRNGVVDLPPGSLVTVGYTAHTYTSQRHYRNISTCVSLNAAFVVLLALPAATAFAYPTTALLSPFTNSVSAAASYPIPTPAPTFIPASRPILEASRATSSIEDIVYYEDLF